MFVAQRGDRDRFPETRRPLGRRDADAVVALAPPQLGGLAGDVAQPCEHRARGGQQPVLTGRGAQLGQTGAEDEAALHVTRHQAVVRRWHLSGDIVLPLGALALLAPIAWGMFAEAPQPDKPDLANALISTLAFAVGIFTMIAGWVLWQKR